MYKKVSSENILVLTFVNMKQTKKEKENYIGLKPYTSRYSFYCLRSILINDYILKIKGVKHTPFICLNTDHIAEFIFCC